MVFLGIQAHKKTKFCTVKPRVTGSAKVSGFILSKPTVISTTHFSETQLPEKRWGERTAKFRRKRKVPSSLRILLRTQYISVVENATPETKGKGELSANPDNRFLRIPPAYTSTTEITTYWQWLAELDWTYWSRDLSLTRLVQSMCARPG